MISVYIDGSHHYKSGVSGWGVAVYEGDTLKEEFYGEVPEEFKLSYEHFAYTKAVSYLIEHKIEGATIYTDLKSLERCDRVLDLVQKYDPTITSVPVIKTLYIDRKYNKAADKLSRGHLMSLYEKERDAFLEIHGQPKERKVNFFHMSYLGHSIVHKNTEKRVLYAVKKEHLIMKVDKSSMEVYYEGQEKNSVLVENAEDILRCVAQYAKNSTKILLVIPDYPDLFDKIVNKSEDVQVYLRDLEEIFVYNKPIDTPPKKHSRAPKEYSKELVLEKAGSSNRFFQVLIGRDFREFREKAGRNPSKEERQSIVKARMSELHYPRPR